MIVKKHFGDHKLLLAICDDVLLGKKIENERCVLDLSSHFYKGEKTDLPELKILLERAYMINAVGKDSIKTLARLNIISEEDAKEIEGTPYVQVVFEEKRN